MAHRMSPDIAYKLALTSALAYPHNEDGLVHEAYAAGLPVGDLCQIDKKDTQAVIMRDDHNMYLGFRGTEFILEDVITDIKFGKVNNILGRAHEGFSHALDDVWEDIVPIIMSLKGDRQLYLTGHSLGAALATLCRIKLWYLFEMPAIKYTFGEPRSLDDKAAAKYNTLFKDDYRFVCNNDVVTRVPTRSMGYSHCGEFWYIDTEGEIGCDPSWWEYFWDRVEGRLEDFGKLGTDGIKDHNIMDYAAALKPA